MKQTLYILSLCLFFSLVGMSWDAAACPEGTTQTYKGCEAIDGDVTEEKEVTAATVKLEEEKDVGAVSGLMHLLKTIFTTPSKSEKSVKFALFFINKIN